MKHGRSLRVLMAGASVVCCALGVLVPRCGRAQGIGSAVSPAFSVYVGSDYQAPAGGGIGSAVSTAFSVYVGSDYQAPADGAIGSATSVDFALWLGRFSEGSALSPLFSLDTQSADPGFVTSPYGLTATRGPCGAGVELHWTQDAGDQTGFEIDGKPAGSSDIWYERLATVGPAARTFLHLPYDGLARTYRVRAVRGSAVSAYSNAATGPAPPIPGGTQAPAGLTVKSIGDGNGLRVLVMPPTNTTQWDGTSSVQVEQATSTDFDQDVVATQSHVYSGTGGRLLRFDGQRGQPYYFRVRIVPVCGQPSGYVGAGPLTPRYAPVLLVHGIWGSASGWGSVWSEALADAGFETGRFHAAEFRYCGDTWLAWGQELRTNVLPSLLAPGRAWADDESVDVIAHSQGGLATRYCVESLAGASLVRTLVMIATPNHGGKYAAFSSFLHNAGVEFPGCAPLANSVGVTALAANSTALRRLNFGNDYQQDGGCLDEPDELIMSRKGTVEYYTIAGTGPNILECNPLNQAQFIWCLWQQLQEDPGDCVSDGVVRAQSVHLRALDGTHQFRDVDIGAGGTAHSGGLQVPGLSVPILESAVVADWAVSLLRRPNGHDQGIQSEPMASRSDAQLAAGVERPSRPAQTTHGMSSGSTSDSLFLLASVRDSLAGGTLRSYAIASDSIAQLIVVGSWQDSTLALRLRGPDATLYAPADTAGRPWLHYEGNDTLGYAAFAVDDPAVGTWSVEVEAPPGPYTAHYQADWIAKWGGYRLVASLDADVVVPGDTLSMTASLLASGGPVQASCTAVLLAPGGGVDSLQLHDDGLNGDVAAGDGIHSAWYVAPLAGGDYHLQLMGRTAEGGSSPTQRTRTFRFSVASAPDLECAPHLLAVAPPITAVGRLTELRAVIHNRGFTVADSAAVVFEDATTGELLATTQVGIAAADSVETRILWTPQVAGIHTIRVSAELPGATEADVSNNSADLLVPVAAAPPAAGVDSVGVQLTRFELAPPRPNPFRSTVHFDFAVPRPARVAIEVFDVQGRRVKRVVDEVLAPGRHTRAWRGDDDSGASVRSGVFFVRFTGPGFAQTRRAVLLR